MKKHLSLLFAAFAFTTTAARAQTISNPSFEVNSFANFPGYIFTPGNGGIAGWSHNGAVGLNPAGGNPFADNGAVPQGSNVAFIQSVNLPGDYANGVSLLNTVITGLTPGVSYTVSFRANSRTSSFYGAPTPSWSVNGEAFLPFTAAPSVGGANAYYTVARTFTATAATAPLNIMNNTAVTGGPADTTVLVDAFTIAVVPPVVTNTNDSGAGSLRQMLAYAATIPGANTVTFDPALSGATIVLGSEIVITDAASVTVDAGSLPAGVTISGNNATRIFTVSSGKNLALLGLTLTGGNGGGALQPGNGGAIVNFGTLALTRCMLSGNAASNGGAILNDDGTLTLTQCILSGNSTVAGGAIFQTSGTLTLTACTLSQNSASASGGAIQNQTGAMTLTHCTFSGNQASSGGAIYVQIAGTETLTHCTVSGNSASSFGGAFRSFGGTLTLTHCIVAANTAGNSGPDFFNTHPATATGVNFIGETAGSGLVASATLLTTAANGPINLAPLGSNGGPTKTMVPQPGSPAIDAATILGGLTTDQRGFPRNVDGDGNETATPDIGAVEFQRAFVSTNNDELNGDPFTSLREAIRDGADLVVFHGAFSGLAITLSTALGGEIVPGKNVVIDATSLPAGLTIDGGAGANRLFTVSSGNSLTLLGLTLTGGNGGGAFQSGNGGAIVNFGTLALTRCTLSGNGNASGSGGAILNDGGSLTLTQCTLSGNSTTTGGAIFQTTGSTTLTQCALTGNSAVAGGAGGAIFTQNGTVTLTHCTLSGNQSNTSGGDGGAIDQTAGTLSLTHCTVSGNQASGSGGAIHNIAGTLILTNSVVAGNTAGFAPDIVNGGPITPTGVNFIGDPAGSGLTAGPGIRTTAVNGPINLAPLGSYGGPTFTHALQPGSPARNAASGSTATTDQRGFPIVGTPDLGAYEAGTFTNYNAYIWETLPVTATAPQHASGVDFDGDGVTNGHEWLAITNAADPTNYLRITEVFLATGDIHFRFPTVVGRSYQFEFSLNLASGIWTPIDGPLPGTGGTVTHIIGPVTGQPQLFFRIRVGP